MNIILSIQGGIGKSVIATAVCRAIKMQHPECRLIVITGYPEVFSNNPRVDMVFNHGQETYFYGKYVEGCDVKIFANEPYMVTEHILRRESVAETWCRMNGIAFQGNTPEVYTNEREFQFYANKYPMDRPIMVIQTNGGGQTDIRHSWARDMPPSVSSAVVEEFKSRYKIYHIRRDDQPALKDTTPVHESFKGVACLLARSHKRILIDSFCQHTAAALGKKSTVLWVCNSPKVFGYEIHDNMLPNPENGTPDLKFSLFSKYNIGGVPHEFPYRSEADIFNLDRVMESLINQ